MSILGELAALISKRNSASQAQPRQHFGHVTGIVDSVPGSGPITVKLNGSTVATDAYTIDGPRSHLVVGSRVSVLVVGSSSIVIGQISA